MYRHSMPTYIPENFGQVLHSITLSGDSNPFAVTYGLNAIVADPGAGDLQAIVDELHDAFADCWTQEASNQHTLVRTELRFVLVEGEEPVIAVGLGDRVGASTGATVPQNTSGLVHKRTARSGRRGRGRIYWPSIPEAGVDNKGLLDGTYKSNVQTDLTAWLARFNTGPLADIYMCILHQYTGTLPDPVPSSLAPDVVTSLQYDDMVATQRRRLRS